MNKLVNLILSENEDFVARVQQLADELGAKLKSKPDPDGPEHGTFFTLVMPYGPVDYGISVRPGYLGASETAKEPKGENWLRGRDLSDGPANEETWQEIVKDIQA